MVEWIGGSLREFKNFWINKGWFYLDIRRGKVWIVIGKLYINYGYDPRRSEGRRC